MASANSSARNALNQPCQTDESKKKLKQGLVAFIDWFTLYIITAVE